MLGGNGNRFARWLRYWVPGGSGDGMLGRLRKALVIIVSVGAASHVHTVGDILVEALCPHRRVVSPVPIARRANGSHETISSRLWNFTRRRLRLPTGDNLERPDANADVKRLRARSVDVDVLDVPV